MRRLLPAILAFLICCSSCTKSETVIYQISSSLDEFSKSGDPRCDAAKLVEQMTLELGEFGKKHETDFSTAIHVKSGSMKNADRAALSRFNYYLNELQTIYSDYQAKFDALGADWYSFKMVQTMTISRISENTEVLKKESVSIKHNAD